MSKYTTKVRNELLRMLAEERSNKRCELCKELHEVGKKLTAEIDPQIEDLRNRLSDLEKEKRTILDDAKLSTYRVGYDQCASDVLHPDLIAFDDETNRLKKEILTS